MGCVRCVGWMERDGCDHKDKDQDTQVHGVFLVSRASIHQGNEQAGGWAGVSVSMKCFGA